MGNAVEPCPLLVDRLDHPPRRLGNVGAMEHLFLGLGIKLPAGRATARPSGSASIA
jgi:hypothetical protein